MGTALCLGFWASGLLGFWAFGLLGFWASGLLGSGDLGRSAGVFDVSEVFSYIKVVLLRCLEVS